MPESATAAQPLTRVLVTGGTGAIGAWVVRDLAERGITPIVLTRGRAEDRGKAINGDIADRISMWSVDLLDPRAVENAIRESGAQAIVHMASTKPPAVDPPWAPAPDPGTALEQIAVVTGNLLEASRRSGIKRFVYASTKLVSAPVVGEHAAPRYLPLSEDYPDAPTTLYGIGKLAAESIGFYYARKFDLEFVAIRMSSTWGPLRKDTKPSPASYLYAALNGETVRIRRFLPGAKDDIAYNRDLAAGLVLATLARRPSYPKYNLGSGTGIDHEDIARALRVAVPSVRIEFLDPDLPGESDALRLQAAEVESERRVLDISRARLDLGYEPRYVPMELAYADFLAQEKRMASFVKSS